MDHRDDAVDGRMGIYRYSAVDGGREYLSTHPIRIGADLCRYADLRVEHGESRGEDGTRGVVGIGVVDVDEVIARQLEAHVFIGQRQPVVGVGHGGVEGYGWV